MYRTLLIPLLLLLSLPGAWAYSSWGEPIKTEIRDSKVWFIYKWSIVDDSLPVPGDVTCANNASECYVGFYPRSGLGPIGKLCDAGGTCNGTASSVHDISIKVRANTSWESAYQAYVSKFSMSGGASVPIASVEEMKDAAWGTLCVGFGALPAASAGVAVLAPNTTCGLFSKPDTQCTISLGSEINLGTVAPGQSIPDGSVSGWFSCSGAGADGASIGASLLTSNPKLGGKPIELTMNGYSMTSTSKVVGRGSYGQLLLKAHVNGTIDAPGSYQSSATIMLNYY
ncbi:hypothetical protein ABIE12_002679 [Serratia sp. 509]